MNQILFAFYCNFWLSFAMLHVTCSLLLYKRQRHHTVFYSFCELVGLVYGCKLFLNVLHFSFKCLWRNWMEKKKTSEAKGAKKWVVTYIFFLVWQPTFYTHLHMSEHMTDREKEGQKANQVLYQEAWAAVCVHSTQAPLCNLYVFFFSFSLPFLSLMACVSGFGTLYGAYVINIVSFPLLLS